jgi:hypothetical protein
VIEDRQIDAVITWQGAGNPLGEDIQDVPEALLKNAGFNRALRKGIFEVIQDQSTIDRYLSAQGDNYTHQRQVESQAVAATLEASNRDQDWIPVKCLVSGEEIMMREGDLAERPPLADRYADRASEFVAQETGEINPITGKSRVRWVRTTTREDALPSQGGI